MLLRLSNGLPEHEISLGIHPHFIKGHIEGWIWFHALDPIADHIPFVSPPGKADRSTLHLNIFQLAKYFAALSHIQGPVGLLEQFGKLVVRPAGFIPGTRL